MGITQLFCIKKRLEIQAFFYDYSSLDASAVSSANTSAYLPEF